MERKLAAILAVDVVGYSRLMEQDEVGTFEGLRAHRKELFEPAIEKHRGRVFKLMGDGLLAEFASVVDAVECAVALQRGMRERNAAVTGDPRIDVRIGVNLGDVIIEGEDRHGEGVNIAARLQQLAAPGGICVSQTVVNHVGNKISLGFEFQGEQRVKNIAQPVKMYRVLADAETNGKTAKTMRIKTRLARSWQWPAAALVVAIAAGAALSWRPWERPAIEPASTERAALPIPDKPSIAVLPFANLSDDPQQAYFADGIAEDLMTGLSRLSGLFVIARHSAFTYKDQELDLRKVGHELGVRYIVEGSVQRTGEQVRINIQLVDASTLGHLWAEKYDGSMADIFALQDRVTKSVVDALALKLTAGEQRALAGQNETAVPQAYDEFLRGWELYQRTTPADFVEAIPHFERAVALDPSYARAHAALAMVYFRSYDQGWTGSLGMTADAAFDRAREYLNLAKVHPTSTSHQVAGNISRDRGWYDDAAKEFQAAIALDPRFLELRLSRLFFDLCRQGSRGRDANRDRHAARSALSVPVRFLSGAGRVRAKSNGRSGDHVGKGGTAQPRRPLAFCVSGRELRPPRTQEGGSRYNCGLQQRARESRRRAVRDDRANRSVGDLHASTEFPSHSGPAPDRYTEHP